MKIQKYFLLHNKKLKPWIKYWLYIKSKDKNYVLSDILQGTSFYLENSSNKNFNLFQINGNSIQDGTPTPSNPVEIENAGEGYINITISNSDNTQSQNYTIPCQQPMRSIGNVRDEFIKQDGTWYEKHNIGQVVLNGSENWEVYSGASNIFFSNISSLPLPKNANLNVFCNYYTSTLSTNSAATFVSETTGLNYAIGTHVTAPIVRIKDIRYTTPSELSSWLSTHNTEVIYQLAEPIYLECTQEQTEALESITQAYTYEPITNINSTDITPAFLKIQYYMEV